MRSLRFPTGLLLLLLLRLAACGTVSYYEHVDGSPLEVSLTIDCGGTNVASGDLVLAGGVTLTLCQGTEVTGLGTMTVPDGASLDVGRCSCDGGGRVTFTAPESVASHAVHGDAGSSVALWHTEWVGYTLVASMEDGEMRDVRLDTPTKEGEPSIYCRGICSFVDVEAVSKGTTVLGCSHACWVANVTVRASSDAFLTAVDLSQPTPPAGNEMGINGLDNVSLEADFGSVLRGADVACLHASGLRFRGTVTRPTPGTPAIHIISDWGYDSKLQCSADPSMSPPQAANAPSLDGGPPTLDLRALDLANGPADAADVVTAVDIFSHGIAIRITDAVVRGRWASGVTVLANAAPTTLRSVSVLPDPGAQVGVEVRFAFGHSSLLDGVTTSGAVEGIAAYAGGHLDVRHTSAANCSTGLRVYFTHADGRLVLSDAALLDNDVGLLLEGSAGAAAVNRSALCGNARWNLETEPAHLDVAAEGTFWGAFNATAIRRGVRDKHYIPTSGGVALHPWTAAALEGEVAGRVGSTETRTGMAGHLARCVAVEAVRAAPAEEPLILVEDDEEWSGQDLDGRGVYVARTGRLALTGPLTNAGGIRVEGNLTAAGFADRPLALAFSDPGLTCINVVAGGNLTLRDADLTGCPSALWVRGHAAATNVSVDLIPTPNSPGVVCHGVCALHNLRLHKVRTRAVECHHACWIEDLSVAAADSSTSVIAVHAKLPDREVVAPRGPIILRRVTATGSVLTKLLYAWQTGLLDADDLHAVWYPTDSLSSIPVYVKVTNAQDPVSPYTVPEGWPAPRRPQDARPSWASVVVTNVSLSRVANTSQPLSASQEGLYVQLNRVAARFSDIHVQGAFMRGVYGILYRYSSVTFERATVRANPAMLTNTFEGIRLSCFYCHDPGLIGAAVSGPSIGLAVSSTSTTSPFRLDDVLIHGCGVGISVGSIETYLQSTRVFTLLNHVGLQVEQAYTSTSSITRGMALCGNRDWNVVLDTSLTLALTEAYWGLLEQDLSRVRWGIKDLRVDAALGMAELVPLLDGPPGLPRLPAPRVWPGAGAGSGTEEAPQLNVTAMLETCAVVEEGRQEPQSNSTRVVTGEEMWEGATDLGGKSLLVAEGGNLTIRGNLTAVSAIRVLGSFALEGSRGAGRSVLAMDPVADWCVLTSVGSRTSVKRVDVEGCTRFLSSEGNVTVEGVDLHTGTDGTALQRRMRPGRFRSAQRRTLRNHLHRSLRAGTRHRGCRHNPYISRGVARAGRDVCNRGYGPPCHRARAPFGEGKRVCTRSHGPPVRPLVWHRRNHRGRCVYFRDAGGDPVCREPALCSVFLRGRAPLVAHQHRRGGRRSHGSRRSGGARGGGQPRCSCDHEQPVPRRHPRLPEPCSHTRVPPKRDW